MTTLSARSSEVGGSRPTTFARMFVGRPPSLTEVLAARNRAIAGLVDSPAEPAAQATQQPVPSEQSGAEQPEGEPASPARVGTAHARSEYRTHGFPRRRRTTWSHYRTAQRTEQVVTETEPQHTPPAGDEPDAVEPTAETVAAETTVEPTAETAAEPTVETVAAETAAVEPAAEPVTAETAVVEPAAEPVTAETELLRSPAAPQPSGYRLPGDDSAARMMIGESLSPERLMNSLLTSLHRVVVARRQHGSAVEDELVRRAELIRAEAEVDAEFIRMRAYVDALSIVSGARSAVDGTAASESWSASVQPLAELVAKLHQEVE